MYIKRLPTNSNIWQIYAVCSDRGDCHVTEFLSSQPPNLETNRDKLIALLDHVSEKGPQRLPEDICHKISDEIWQFTKGRLRLAWFYDEGKLIICTHGFMKQTQKTPKSEIHRAEEAKKLYTQAKEQHTLNVINNDED